MSLKYLSNFWRHLKISLINCEISLILICSKNYVIFPATGESKLAVTDAKRYVPTVIISTQDNSKLLQQLKLGFKTIINWSKYQSRKWTEKQNQYVIFFNWSKLSMSK